MEQPILGASSQRQCQPCPKGYFSDEEGTQFCKACPNGFECPIGSIKPIITQHLKVEYSQQPKNYQNSQDDLDSYNLKINIIVGLLIGFMLLLFLSKSSIKDKLKVIDLFERNHNYELDQFMKLMKTSIGGLFSSFFIVLALALILTNILSYIFDNIVESKALIPFLIMKETYPDIKADFKVIFKFSSYQGMCLSKESQKEEYADCNKDIDYDIGGFSQDSNTLYWNLIQCKKINEDCYVKIQCQSCEVIGPSFIQLNLKEEKSYSSSIQFNVTSTSSIPNEVSSIDIIINPDSEMIFRGPEPTILEVLIIPSAYETNDPKQQKYDGQTGYHVMNSGYYYKGTQLPSTEMQFSSNLYARINFKPSESSLLTKQTLKISAFTLITAVLGSVFGLLNVIGRVMSFIEKQKAKRDKKRNKKFNAIKREIFIKQVNHLKQLFNINPLKIRKSQKRFSIRKVRKMIKERTKSNKVLPSFPLEELYEYCTDNSSHFEKHLKDLRIKKFRPINYNTSVECVNSIQSQYKLKFLAPPNLTVPSEENASQQIEINKDFIVIEDSERERLIVEDNK